MGESVNLAVGYGGDKKMKSRMRHALWAGMMTIFLLLLTSAVNCSAGSATLIYDDLNRLIRVEYSDDWTIEYHYDQFGNRLLKSITYTGEEIVSTPSTPTGPTVGIPGTSYSYSTGGSTSTLGHPVQYQFDWGDGTSPWGASSQSKTWSTQGTYLVRAQARCSIDQSVLSAWSTGLSVIIDNTPPTGTATINGGTTYTNSTSVTLNLTCNDANGCSQMQFSNDNITYSTPEAYTTTKAWTLTSGDGNKTVYAKFKDNPGNWSVPYSDAIVLDTTLPSGTATINGGTTYTNSTSVTLNLTCNDANGCSQMQFSNNNVTYSTPEAYTTTKAWTLTSGDGNKTVYAKFKDNPGNWSVPYSDAIVLDTTPPSGTVTLNGGATYTNSTSVTLTLSCSDANGCSQMQFSNDNVTYSTPEAYNTTKAWTLTSGDGNKTVYAKFKDSAGNWSTPYSDSIVLDTTPPTGGILVDYGASFAKTTNVILALSCSDTAGCSEMRLSNDGQNFDPAVQYATSYNNWNLSSGADGPRTVYVKFKDTLGNWSDDPFSDTIDLISSCSNDPARIGSVSYTSIQDAYDHAVDGNTINCHGVRIEEDLTFDQAHRNYNIYLQGGYDCEFTTFSGNMTVLKGDVQTTPIGGTITIKNFVLEKQ
jgi:YD repeat-containing protein